MCLLNWIISWSTAGPMSQGICTSINWFMWERERGKFLSVGKQNAIEIYHHQHYADMCSAILTCTSFSDNILPGLKGQPCCVATKRVFNIAKTHGFREEGVESKTEGRRVHRFMIWKILSTHHSWGRKPLLTSHLPSASMVAMESGCY